MTSPNDINFMRHALALARRGGGRVAPNPAVGCVIVKDDIVVGRGWTADGGRPHAETIALKQAGGRARNSSVYVSLEPCSHQGETGPCAQALIGEGIQRCVIACTDPDPRVSGRGIAMLEKAGIEVVQGVLEKDALALNAGFVQRITQNRPYITCKITTSADNKIAASPGERTQISGGLASRYMHLERSKHDAILVGANTARIDKPLLTTRLDGYGHRSLRVVLDGGMWLDNEYIDVDPYDLNAVMDVLSARGVTRLLVEGGAKIHAAFLKAGLVDRFLWCKSSIIIGMHGVEALHNLDIERIEEIFGLKQHAERVLGEDVLAIYGASH